MHIYVSKLATIGSDNGLSPGRRQVIIWTNAGILLIRPLWTNFSEILIEIVIFSFKKMRLKVSSAKWRPLCLGLNVLRNTFQCIFSANVPGIINMYLTIIFLIWNSPLPGTNELTHRGSVKRQICYWPGSSLLQVIITCLVPSHYLNQCWLIANWITTNKPQWNSNQYIIFSIQKIHLKLPSARWRPSCSLHNVSMCWIMKAEPS